MHFTSWKLLLRKAEPGGNICISVAVCQRLEPVTEKPSSLYVSVKSWKSGVLPFNIVPFSARSTRKISAKYGHYVLATSRPLTPRWPAHAVITQLHRREGQRSRFNQRTDENIWLWRIKTRNYSGGFIARHLLRRFMGVKVYLLVSLEKSPLTLICYCIFKDCTCRGGRWPRWRQRFAMKALIFSHNRVCL